MYFRFQLQRVLYSVSSSNFIRNFNQVAHKQLYKMKKAYFSHVESEKQFHLTFRYINENFSIDRVFNFNRYTTESITACCDRIRANVEKEFQKKNKKAKNKLCPFEHPNITVEILSSDGSQIIDGTFSDLIPPKESLVLRIMQDDYSVVFNSPWVTAVNLPASILAGFIIYPKIELQFAVQRDCIIKWYRGLPVKSKKDEDIDNWIEVGEGFLYEGKNSDINHKLKISCLPTREILVGPCAEFISKNLVQAGPGVCPFEQRHLFTENKLSDKQFRVMSYNILADLYADSDFARKNLFAYCAQYALDIDYRKQLFIKEVLGYNADLICLQEVDSKVFDLDFTTVFDTIQIKGQYQKKGNSGEGLATFYNTSRFEFVRHEGITIGENIDTLPAFSSLCLQIKCNQRLFNRIVDRGTAVQVTILRSIDNPQKLLLVANTHLYFHPDADHIRLLQMGFCMAFVEDIFQQMKAIYPEDTISIIFCGDFNSVPECGIFKLMTEKLVPNDFVDWNSNKDEAVKNVSLTQPFHFKSACGCPEFTNYTVGFTECIDYIFYQTDNLEVVQIIPLPTNDELQLHIAIPSIVFPSDHIALVADLSWK